jgi:MobA-like NTP transferase domain
MQPRSALDHSDRTGYDAIVLAGGAARRLGGADKPALAVGGVSLLERVVAACADAGTVVVVGPPRPLDRAVRWTREHPAGAGPVAAIAAGLPLTTRTLVAVLAADLPFIAPALPLLRAAVEAERGAENDPRSLPPETAADSESRRLPPHTAADSESRRLPTNSAADSDGGKRSDVAVLVDGSGRRNTLAAVWRRAALVAALERIGDPAGVPVRRLFDGVSCADVIDDGGWGRDCDSWDDLAKAEERTRR